MNPGQIRLLMIGVYLLLLLVLGYIASRSFRGTKQDYLLASHSIGPFLLLMSLFGTTMTAFALVGSTGEAYKNGIGVYGMLASSSGIVHSLCFFIIGVKIYGFGRKYGYSTQIQFFRERLQSDLVGVLLFPILVGLIIPYLLLGVMAAGTVIQAMTAGAFPDIEMFQSFKPDGTPSPLHGGTPPWLGSLVVCLVVLIYVFFGGMRGTAWANAFQTIVFMVLGVVTFVLIANKLGGGQNLMESLSAVSKKVSPEFTTRGGMSKTLFFHLFVDSLVRRDVSASVPALVDRQISEQFQGACCLSSDFHHDRLGALRADRHLGNHHQHSAVDQCQWNPAIPGQNPVVAGDGRFADRRYSGRDHVLAG